MKKGVYLIILVLHSLSLQMLSAQICNGNLGENIFEEGDFGAGEAVVLPVDPDIAPGYTYITSPPPNDGFYTITNDIARWGFAYDWLQPQDNSPDPNGYMMVVNASFQPGLFYEQTVEGLCENTTYEFSADIINLIPRGKNYIQPNVSFLIDEAIVYQTDNIPENETWNTYGFLFDTAPGQTSVKLALQNNAPGGIGNDLALDNITFRPCGPQARIFPLEIENICEDGNPIGLEATVIGTEYDTPAFQWQQSFDEGLTWVTLEGETDSSYIHQELSAGFYYYRYLLANGPNNIDNSKCRVVSNTKIVNVVPKFYTIIDTLCEGLSFQLGARTFDQTGIYIDSLKTSIGCDSIVTLDLTIIPDSEIEVSFEVGDPSCSYTSDGFIRVDSIINTNPPNEIIFNGQASNFSQFDNLAEGEYSYQISDRYGCSFKQTLEVLNPVGFEVDIGEDLSVALGDAVQIQAVSNIAVTRYDWQSNTTIDCDLDCTELNWIPTDSTQLTLTAISANGCVAIDSIQIHVDKTRRVYFPTTFSPNNDGKNDFFTAFAASPHVQEIEEMLIFDRWGELVFEQRNMSANSPSTAWDGYFRGAPVQEGVYYHLTKIRFLDNAVLQYEGEISLVR